MPDLGKLLHSFKPDKIGWFGNQVTKVEVYFHGLRLERKKGNEEYPFEAIDKITAKDYACPTPIYIFIKIYLKNSKNTIEFQLHPNLIDTNALLNTYSDFLLGEDFPHNLETLDLELGGLGSPMRLQNGKIFLRTREFALSEVENFARNNNGFYNLKLSSVKQNVGIKPENAQNIVSTIKIMDEIMKRNQSSRHE